MNMFEEIEAVKKDFPKVKTISKEISNYKLNAYQAFAIVLFIICFCIGIVFGNLFPTCGSISGFNSTCSTKEFNFFLMIAIWSGSLLVCIFFFAIGHVIELLKNINNKLDKAK